MTERVVVRAPATVANLGPGFDALGLALGWYDEVRVERAGTLEITATGLGAEGIKRDASNGIARAIAAVCGQDPPPVRINKMTAVAFGRGFGSSAISIVAGLVAGRALFATEHTDDELLALAVEMEGHPDNVAPCLLGGVVVSADGRSMRLDPPAGIGALVCVAPNRLATKTARGVLPETLSRADAVANAARAALLTASLATGRADTLFEATHDVLHQPARFELMPDTGDLVRALRSEGIAAFLSGAGPSVTALVAEADAEQALAVARARASEGWDVRLESLDRDGAAVVDQR